MHWRASGPVTGLEYFVRLLYMHLPFVMFLNNSKLLAGTARCSCGVKIARERFFNCLRGDRMAGNVLYDILIGLFLLSNALSAGQVYKVKICYCYKGMS